MAVDVFDPSALGGPLDDALVRDLCALGAAMSTDELTLSALDVARFAPLATHPDWSKRAATLSEAEIRALIRVFTLGEMQYSSWSAGEKSAVVPLVKALKAREAYDKEITRWIKAHTTNRFLPHGSLLSRL